MPIESELLTAAIALESRGAEGFHGFLIAHEMRDRSGAKNLIAYGNLYRVLERMEKAGWLESAWEDPELSTLERRPRRRVYRLTGLGAIAAQQSRSAELGAQQLVGN